MYQPDNWVVIKVKNTDETFYKILAGWSGSYLNGTSWRMNSGVVDVKEDGDYFLFVGSTGSIYKCHKESYGLKMNNAGIWYQLKEKYPDRVEMLDETNDWKNFNWMN
jgi:hypothetical protein